MKLFIRWLIIAVSLVVAVMVVPGIRVEGNAWVAVAVMALVLGLINIFIKPILKFLSCGFIILTLGLFLIVINAFTLWFASYVCVNWLNIGFIVEGFIPALFGGIIISVVSFVLSFIFPDEE